MRCASSKNCRIRLGVHGSTSLETALVLLPFLMLLFAGIDLGRFFMTTQSMLMLVTNAGHAALVANTANASMPCGVNSWPDGTALVPLLDPTQVNLCMAATGFDEFGHVTGVTVTVTYPFTTFMPLPSGFSWLPSGNLTRSITYSY
jgi:Flp pilus assembly protein TadG